MFKKKILMICSIFLLGFANLLSADTIFTEDFGTDAFDKSQWVEVKDDGVTVVDRYEGSEPGYGGDGFAALLSPNYQTALTMIDGVDTTGASQVVVDLWAMLHVIDDGGKSESSHYIKIYINDKDNPDTFTQYGDTHFPSNFGLDTWSNINIVLTDPIYMFDGFKVQLQAKTKKSGYTGEAYFDKVTVDAEYGKEPKPAVDPFPADGSSDIIVSDQQLSWTAGYLSVSHDVYLGTDLDDVNDAVDTSPLCVGNDQTETTYTPTLAYNKTYYWRVDENYDGADAEFGVTGTLKGTVWSFSTLPAAPGDPNLIGWWNFESGDAADSSGYNQHGTLNGDATIVDDAERGKVLQLDGDGDFVSTSVNAFVLLNDEVTVSLWTFGGDTLPVNTSVFRADDESGTRVLNSHLPYGNGSVYWYAGSSDSISKAAATDDYKGQWNHWAFTKDAASGEMKMYVNGVLFHSNTGRTRLLDGIARFTIGSNADEVTNFYEGLIDDVEIYNKVLSAADIEAKVANSFHRSRMPSPASATSPFDDQNPTLTWTAAFDAVSHDVYFGTNETEVSDANRAVNFGTYKGSKSTAQYVVPTGSLAFGQTYYWRVDEVNASNNIVKGNVWWFEMRSHLLIDDMEDYNDTTKPIYDTGGWRDWYYNPQAFGLTYIGVSPEPVKSGQQSLKLVYDNYDYYAYPVAFSETVKLYTTSQDWMNNNLKMLTIPVYGQATNGADTLYVALEDASGNDFMIENDDPNVLLTEEWQMWNIPLSEFTGVDLSKIKKIFLGVGTRYQTTTPPVPLSGSVYFDDLIVSPPTCQPDIIKPDGDLTNDCIVDFADIQIMADSWLDRDVIITPEPVGNSNLEGYWNFDNSTAADSSGNAHNGTMQGNAQITNDPNRGKVLLLDGINSYVEIGDFDYTNSSNEFSLGFWFRANSKVEAYLPYVFDHGSGPLFAFNNVDMYLRTNEGGLTSRIILDGVGSKAEAADRWQKTSTGIYDDGQWYYYTVTLSATTATAYIDGEIVAGPDPIAHAGNTIDPNQNIFLGAANFAGTIDRFFDGSIDDVRLYSRVLSHGEILTLAGITNDVVLSTADPLVNLSADGTLGQEIIDYKDFSVIADQWLEEVLWP